MKSSDLHAAAPGFSVTANGTTADPSSNSPGSWEWIFQRSLCLCCHSPLQVTGLASATPSQEVETHSALSRFLSRLTAHTNSYTANTHY